MSGCVGCHMETTSEDSPMLIGQANGAKAAHVEFVIATLGRRAGDRAWVTGTDVDQMIEHGWVTRS